MHVKEFDDLYTVLQTFNEQELFYREYHLAKQQSPEVFEQYIQSLDRKEMDRLFVWLPELPTYSSHYFDEYALDAPNCNVGVSRHNRYTPVFRHSHAYFEMIYVLRGSCQNVIESQELCMKEGDLCILAPDVFHTLYVGDDESLVINIKIRKSTFKEAFFDLFADNAALSVFFTKVLYSDHENSYISYHTKNNDYLHALLLYLIEEGTVEQAYTKNARDSLLRAIFCVLLRDEEGLLCSANASSDLMVITHVLSDIQSQYQTISLGELAKKFHYSEDYLGRLIKKYTGTTFVKILQETRFKKVCQLLTVSNLQIVEICNLVGYDSLAFFNQTFKKRYGMTPKEYRKRYAEQPISEKHQEIPKG